MKCRDNIQQVREATEFIINGMMSGCIQMSAAAKDAYRELVYQFCEDNKDIVSPAQCQTCLNDFEFFLSLLDEVSAARRS